MTVGGEGRARLVHPALAVICLSGAALLGGTGLFLGALFLHAAPANALSQEYRQELDAVVYPEFEQNWKLFAPNPCSRTSPQTPGCRRSPTTARCTPGTGPR